MAETTETTTGWTAEVLETFFPAHVIHVSAANGSTGGENNSAKKQAPAA